MHRRMAAGLALALALPLSGTGEATAPASSRPAAEPLFRMADAPGMPRAIAPVEPPAESLAATPVVMPPEPFRELGTASWYGPGFEGQTMAGGRRFDRKRLTAAHRTLPLGTRARIINIENGRVVEVTVTDRGPYVAGRVIDLSERAAKRLGMIRAGLAGVLIEVAGDDKG